jgi:hypothetical protein
MEGFQLRFQIPCRRHLPNAIGRSFADFHLDLEERLEHGHQLFDQLDEQLN